MNYIEPLRSKEHITKIEEYLSKTNKRNRLIFIFGINTGLRVSDILSLNIGDVKENRTRFIVISKKNLHLGNQERTSIVFNTKNESGALLKILEIFYNNKINLVYLESRPSKDVLGEYNFFTDIDQGYEDIKDVLDKIAWKCNFYKLLGSYPNL